MFDIEDWEDRRIGRVRFCGELTDSDFDVLEASARLNHRHIMLPLGVFLSGSAKAIAGTTHRAHD
jgi:hypothetical protein